MRMPAFTIMFLAGLVATAARSAPLQVYGRLPSLEDIALSPDGTRIAYVRTEGDDRVVVARVLETGEALGTIRAGAFKLRSVSWADNNHLLIMESQLAKLNALAGGAREWFQLLDYNVQTRFTEIVPDGRWFPNENIFSYVSGAPTVRKVQGRTVAFVPGIHLSNKTMPVLIRIDLDSNSQSVAQWGKPTTRGWLIAEDGSIAAEQFYDDSARTWALKVPRSGQLQEIASIVAPLDVPRLLGFGPNSDAALIETTSDGAPTWRLMSLTDGSFGSPPAETQRWSEPIVDQLSGHLVGGIWVDDDVHYEFSDPTLRNNWSAILDTFRGERLALVSYSGDFSRVVVRVFGARDGYAYVLIDLKAHRKMRLDEVYSGLGIPLEPRMIDYPAADGLQVSAVLTLPTGTEPHNLPLVVVPHYAPISRARPDFDWWTQALAAQGYAVLQPNSRGSNTNPQFLTAGYGQMGRKMQTDLSDGVRYLVAQGTVDPARVCIIGDNYGGYAALVGVALQPEVYRCAVSVSGFSDLKRFLKAMDRGHFEFYARSWERLMGVTGDSDSKLDEISPIKHVDAIRAPVLLIHGRDDTTVPFEQSNEMYEALHRANKEVQFVQLEHEDHFLSRSATRLQMLQATVDFLRAHNPPN